MKAILISGAAVFMLGAADSAVAQHDILDTHPPAIRKWAIPSDTGHYIGYWVGGGALSRKRGDAPYADEGTWGWDYRGWLIPRRVNLLWWHGRRYQGGAGNYKTDGPRLPHLHEEGHETPGH